MHVQLFSGRIGTDKAAAAALGNTVSERARAHA